MTGAGRRPTLDDVATTAGVSLKTASRALNDEYGVAASTRDRVREAAHRLGYRPNHMARSLAARRPSAALGLVLSHVSDPFVAALVGGVEDVVRSRDLTLITASHGDDPSRQRAIVQALVERRVDALILMPAPGDLSYLRSELGHGVTAVAVDRPAEGVELDTVVVDNAAGARRAVEILLDRGHRRIASLGTSSRLWTLRARHEGYLAALAAAGLSVDPDLVALDCGDAAGARAALTRMLSLGDPPTAVLATQYAAGRGALRLVAGPLPGPPRGRPAGPPLDIAVVDEMIDTTLMAVPPAVVVHSLPEELGAAAATMVAERLDGLTAPARRIVLDQRIAVAPR